MIDFSIYKHWLPNIIRLTVLLWVVLLVILLFIVLFPLVWLTPIREMLKESDELIQRALEM